MFFDGPPQYDPEVTKLLRETYPNLDCLLLIPAIKRLDGVAFLGTVAHVHGLRDSSRLEHSLNAARLALQVARKLDLTQIERDAYVLYYILHDIGHLPHSHVSEPLLRVFSARYKFHESFGRAKIRDLKEVSSWCSRNLKQGKEVWSTIVNLVDRRNAPKLTTLSQLIEFTLNVDRVEGITRTAKTLGLKTPSPEDVLNGIRFEGRELSYRSKYLPIAAAFWKTQAQVYEKHVFNIRNQSAEAMLKKAFSLAIEQRHIEEDFPSLIDAEALLRVTSDSRSRFLVETLANGHVLTPYWVLRETELWSNETGAVGSRLCSNVEWLANLEEAISGSDLMDVGPPEQIAVHLTRWRQFFTNNALLFQTQLFDLSLYALENLFQFRKTPGMIPVGIFGPPFARFTKIPPPRYVSDIRNSPLAKANLLDFDDPGQLPGPLLT